MVVELEDCLTLTIPDAFSPNGDGVNDQYVIDNLESYPGTACRCSIAGKQGAGPDALPQRLGWAQ